MAGDRGGEALGAAADQAHAGHVPPAADPGAGARGRRAQAAAVRRAVRALTNHRFQGPVRVAIRRAVHLLMTHLVTVSGLSVAVRRTVHGRTHALRGC